MRCNGVQLDPVLSLQAGFHYIFGMNEKTQFKNVGGRSVTFLVLIIIMEICKAPTPRTLSGKCYPQFNKS